MASIPTAASQPRDSQTCTLPDGRTVGFAEYGAPGGHPVLYFHGFPASRLEAAMTDKQARRHNVRVLALDRPGCGLSTPRRPPAPGRSTTTTTTTTTTMADYADDVLAFAAAQNLPRFGLLGMSGGGPYALACASTIPASRLSHVGILAGAGPWGQREVPLQLRVTGFLAHHWPGLLRMWVAGLAGSLEWLARTRLVSLCVDRWLAQKAKKEAARRAAAKAARQAARQAERAREQAERENKIALVDMEASMVGGDYEEIGAASVASLWADEAPLSLRREEEEKDDEEDDEDDEEDYDPDAGLTLAERREKLYARLFGAFAQGPNGVVDDARAICSAPTYTPEDIAYNPIVFWHGDADTNVPLAWAKPTMDRIPHSILKVYPGRTHFSIAEEMDDIMSFYDPRMWPHGAKE